MTICNINPETGIRYGVVSGNNIPELLDHIQTNGRNLTYEAALEEFKAERSNNHCDDDDNDDDDDEFFFDFYSDDIEEYLLEDEDSKLLLSGLGGAPLIWIMKSPNIVYVQSLCSPCVPNAADLDSGLTTEDEGYECYGLPDEWSIKP